MALVVQKYGGSSVANVERMQRVAKRIAKTVDAGNQVVVVVSAMGDTTDDLIALAHQLNEDPPAREMDMLMACGEQQSMALLAMTLAAMGKKAISFTGQQAGVRTEGVHRRAKIRTIETSNLQRALADGNIIIVAGFQGVDDNGEIFTLGRGGSDTSAVALAIGLKADYCEIYTDVDGVYTADPRIVPKARKIKEISFDEMLEMAHLGAGVLNVRSVEVAKLHNMPICVRSSFNENEGTMVRGGCYMEQMTQLEKEMFVTGVACDKDVVKVTLIDVEDASGMASALFNALANEKINVDMIVQSGAREGKNDISFSTGTEELPKLKRIMESVRQEVKAKSFTVEEGVAKVSIIGAGMANNPGVAAKMFKVLADLDINIGMISTSEIKVSCVIAKEQVNAAMQALHTSFGLDGE